VRKFAQHVLPFGFKRIRYYGFWNSTGRAKILESIKAKGSAVADCVKALLAVASKIVDGCKRGQAVLIDIGT